MEDIKMIKKEITMSDGKTYMIGFVERGTYNKLIDCHILEKGIFTYKSVFMKSHWKGLCPDYKRMAIWTVLDYKKEIEQKHYLNTVSWA
jgi:hypothetical protein